MGNKLSEDFPVGVTTPTPPYVRPSEWLDMPILTDTDKECDILVQVFDTDSEYVCLNFSGTFTIDWGDGNIETGQSGTVEHKYVFADCDTTSYGYNIALIKVTNTSGGWTTIDTTIKHTVLARDQSDTTPFLDISIAGEDLTSVKLYNSLYNNNRNFKMQVFSLRKNAITDMSYMFYFCYSLISIPLLATSSVTDMSYMFPYCYSLTSIPLLATSSVTNMYRMFYYCHSLTSIPLLNTASVTNMSSMFYYCYSLTSIPLLNTALVEDMNAMFSYCYSLTSIPLLATSSVTNMSYMFYYCYSLISIPLLATSSVTNMFQMFSYCHSLTSIPLLATSSVASMYRMFSYCHSLTSIPLLNTSSVANMYRMFYYCHSLKKATLSQTKVTISYENCRLSTLELIDILNNLATVTSETITLTGNHGVDMGNTDFTNAIAGAVAKNWTVTTS